MNFSSSSCCSPHDQGWLGKPFVNSEEPEAYTPEKLQVDGLENKEGHGPPKGHLPSSHNFAGKGGTSHPKGCLSPTQFCSVLLMYSRYIT